MTERPMQLPLALFLLLAISTTSGRFSCPEDLPCSCNYESKENKYNIYCSTNSTSNSGFDINIQPENMVRIWCKNFPDWSQFLQGAAVNIGPVNKFEFIECAPPGPMYSTRIVESQMNVQGVKYLSYSNNILLGQLSTQDLKPFPHVETLVLHGTQMWENQVSQDFLSGLPHLKQLDLSMTWFQNPQGFFDNSSSLEMLDLSFYGLKYLTPGTFDGLKRIKVLNLETNNFQKLKPGVFRRLQSLVELDISENKLKTLPVNIFADLKNLEIIEFSQNNFDSLPSDLFLHNPKLKIVKLFRNRGNLTTLPGRLLSNFAHLEIVSLDNSKFLSIPEDLFWGSINIIELNLKRNHLSMLPGKIFRDAAELQTLSLSYNELKDLNAGIFSNNKKLVELDLSKNHLTFIDERTFAGLESLQELNMEYNDLSHIHIDAFASLKQLKIARFGDNKLTLPIGVGQFFHQFSPFHPCSSLEILDLSYNNITAMFIDWITSSENFRKLDLSHNNFEYLQALDLQFMSMNNIEVNLSYNNIRQINLSCIIDYNFADHRYIIPSNISKLILASNPIQYDCDVYDLVNHLNNHLNNRMNSRGQGLVKLEIEGMDCDGPEHVADSHISRLSTDLDNTRAFKCLVDEPLETNKGDLCASDSICVCSKRLWDNTLLIDCAGRNLTAPPEFIDTRGVDLVELDLSVNELKTAPNMSAKGYNKVASLNLAGNKLTDLEESLITPNLKILNLYGNNLTSVNSEFLKRLLSNESNISQLSLTNNPWRCDCSSGDLHYFVRHGFKRYPDLLNISCRNSNVSLLTFCIPSTKPSPINKSTR